MADGVQLRDRALAAVDAHAARAWRRHAFAAVVALARSGRRFTAEDAANTIPDGIVTHEPRAMGPVILRALADKVITQVGWTAAANPQSHAGPRRVYRGSQWVDDPTTSTH